MAERKKFAFTEEDIQVPASCWRATRKKRAKKRSLDAKGKGKGKAKGKPAAKGKKKPAGNAVGVLKRTNSRNVPAI